MAFDPNNLYYWMVRKYHDHKTDTNKLIFCNEGSSRSSKTFDAFHLIYTYLSHHQNEGLNVYVFRATLKNSREKAYATDFVKFAKIVGFYNSADAIGENTSPEYTLFGNKIKFRGLDKDSEAVDNDIFFLNEALECQSENQVKGWLMRCTRFAIFDWNPSKVRHWIFNYEGRPDVFFSKTTYLNNKHCPPAVIKHIESTSPWNLEDLHLPIKERRPHETNIAEGTADEWYFRVYGMGERTNKDNVVFPKVEKADKIPDYANFLAGGVDFSNAEGIDSDPHSIIKGYIADKCLYLKGVYEGIDPVVKFVNGKVASDINHPNDLVSHIRKATTERNIRGECPWMCDRSNGGNIKTLRANMIDARPYEGQYFILDGISKLNKFQKIYIVDTPWLYEEFIQYEWDTDTTDGKPITDKPPRKQKDHGIAAARYLVQIVGI